jgi:uncharacterized repeat protein (TIGR03803 family)
VRRVNLVVMLLVLGFALGIASAQTFTTLYRFNGTDGANPAGLVQAINGYLYGTTQNGTVFKITPTGTFDTTSISCTKGCSGLVGGAIGEYLATLGGGANNSGTILEIGSNDTLTTLYTFCSQIACEDGSTPFALAQGANGNLYGATRSGGTCCGDTIFKITPKGTFTTLYNSCVEAGCPTGPSGLVQAANGDFYGTTQQGGSQLCPGGCGTVFKMTPGGTFTTIYDFCAQTDCPAGNPYPAGALVQATNGYLYGTTNSGGAYGEGSVFKITPTGTFTTLYSFCADEFCSDGGKPTAGLVQATDGNLYGTTTWGGLYGPGSVGTIFKITPEGTLTTIYNFCQGGCADGEYPQAGLIQGTDGNLYGTTIYGGTFGSGAGQSGWGTVFKLSIGLGPFVETRPSIGVVGEVVAILGYGLKGATGVMFNGIPATILYAAPTVIYARVPAGATTGKVQVVTPSGTLTSNVVFEVAP